MDKIRHNEQQLFTDIRQLIDDARLMASKVVSSGVTALYWNIGTRISKEILNNQRAEYGHQIVATLSRQLCWSRHKLLLPIKDELQNRTDDE